MPTGLVQRLTAEAVGTLLLVFLGCAAAIAAGGSLLVIALAFAFALAVAYWVFGPTSGGHFNPAVSVGLALRGRFAWADVPWYVGAQLVGGFAGGLLVWAVYGSDGEAAGLGASRLAEDASSGAGLIGALVAEAIIAMLLVVAYLALTDGDRAGERSTGIGLGLTYGVGILAVGAITLGSANFARTLGPELTLALAGGATEWADIWVYLVGPLVGAAAAAFLYPMLRPAPATPAE
jgi:MIP family channel proteins